MFTLKRGIAAALVVTGSFALGLSPGMAKGSSQPSLNQQSLVSVLGDVAPWVPTYRDIPVYVDGKLVGYIRVVEWIWVPDKGDMNQEK